MLVCKLSLISVIVFEMCCKWNASSFISDSLRHHGPCQAPLSMEFFRQEYWSGLPFPSPGDLPNPGIEPRSSLQAGSLPSEPPGRSWCCGSSFIASFTVHCYLTRKQEKLWLELKLNFLKVYFDLLKVVFFIMVDNPLLCLFFVFVWSVQENFLL